MEDVKKLKPGEIVHWTFVLLCILLLFGAAAFIWSQITGHGSWQGFGPTTTSSKDCDGATGVPEAYKPFIKAAADKWLNGDQAIIIAVIQVEDGSWDPNTVNKYNGKATGLGQFFAQTAGGMAEFTGGPDVRGDELKEGYKVRNWDGPNESIGESLGDPPGPKDVRKEAERSIYGIAHNMYGFLKKYNNNLYNAYKFGYHKLSASVDKDAQNVVDHYAKLNSDGSCKSETTVIELNTNRSAQSNNKFSVCLDPGHPSDGKNYGADRPPVYEHKVAWTLANKVKKILLSKGIPVTMTKSSQEEMVLNQRRAEICNQSKSSVMLRFHVDGGAVSRSGLDTYVPTHKENDGKGHKGPSQSVINSSGKYAKIFVNGLKPKLQGQLTVYNARSDDDTERKNLIGSIFSQIPVMLIECGNIRNDNDYQWLQKDSNLDILASAIVDGLLAIKNAI